MEPGELLAEELAAFERALSDALEPQSAYLTEVERAMYRGGKRVRPMLLILAARVSQPAPAHARPLEEKTIRAAAALEMLHVASLIHDDIVDAAPLRRGSATVGAARGPHVALLVGDLQFVQALRCFASAVSTQRDMTLVRVVLDAGFNLCCGQLDELVATPGATPEARRDQWIRTADRKTSALLGMACETGAMLVNARHRATWALGRYGRLVGRAFQIMDDLRDMVESEARAGKRRGTDLIQGRVTLPLIYAEPDLPVGSPALGVLRGQAVEPHLAERAADDIVATPGFLRAYAEGRQAVVDAVGLLASFPEGPYRAALEAIAYDVVNRQFADDPDPTPTKESADVLAAQR